MEKDEEEEEEEGETNQPEEFKSCLACEVGPVSVSAEPARCVSECFPYAY